MRFTKLIFILILITFCETGKSQIHIVRSTSIKTEESPGEFVLRFYNWYLKKIYPGHDGFSTPTIRLIKDSIYQITPQAQFDKLKKTGFFSDKFYKNQLIIYNKCDVQLRVAKQRDVDKCGCSPAEFVKNNDCDFVFYYTWVGGQGENLNTVRIEKTETSANTSKVTAGISDGKVLFSHAVVTLLKENGSWKISDITVFVI